MIHENARIPYESPGAEFLGFECAELLCSSPNKPGSEMPWFPGEDDDDDTF